jgi:hypothetical protein
MSNTMIVGIIGSNLWRYYGVGNVEFGEAVFN